MWPSVAPARHSRTDAIRHNFSTTFAISLHNVHRAVTCSTHSVHLPRILWIQRIGRCGIEMMEETIMGLEFGPVWQTMDWAGRAGRWGWNRMTGRNPAIDNLETSTREQ